jgi:hypothetical protein
MNFNQWMQVFAFLSVTIILSSLIGGLGYLHKINKIQTNDASFTLILGHVLGIWTAIIAKIFRTQFFSNTKPQN